MLSQWIRVLHSDNGTLTDYTLAAQNDDTIPVPLVSAEDSILIGQHFPFNNMFIDVNTANSNSATISLQTWNGVSYDEAVDILDETASGGVTLARSGSIIFSPDRDLNKWQDVRDTADADGPTEIKAAGLKIYNLHWLRLKVSADLSAGTVLNRLGYRFANTQQLNSIDPDLSQYLTSWESGKTDWDEQLRVASDQVIADLKARGLVLHPGQILRMDEVSLATAYKALTLIYSMLGPDFEFRRTHASEVYKDMLDIKRYTLDWDADGIEDRAEVGGTPQGMLVR